MAINIFISIKARNYNWLQTECNHKLAFYIEQFIFGLNNWLGGSPSPPLPSPPHCHLPQINSNLSHSTEQLLVLAGFALSVSWPVQELERREICIFSNIHSGPSDTVGVQSIGALPPPETIVFLTQVLPCQCRDIALGHGVRGHGTRNRGQRTY